MLELIKPPPRKAKIDPLKACWTASHPCNTCTPIVKNTGCKECGGKGYFTFTMTVPMLRSLVARMVQEEVDDGKD